MNKKNLISFGVMIIITSLFSFMGGRTYEKSTGAETNPRWGDVSRTDRPSRGSTPRGGGVILGEIVSRDDATLTIKLPEGGSKVVFYSTTTALTKGVPAHVDDLSSGVSVMITGSTHGDGSVSAKTIQIRPTTIMRAEVPLLP